MSTQASCSPCVTSHRAAQRCARSRFSTPCAAGKVPRFCGREPRSSSSTVRSCSASAHGSRSSSGAAACSAKLRSHNKQHAVSRTVEVAADDASSSVSKSEQDQLDVIAAAMAERLEEVMVAMDPDEEVDYEALSRLDGDDLDAASAIHAKLSGKQSRKRASRMDGERPADREVPLHLLPKVAVVGRPNVGKSALFNRIAGSNVAIVYDFPGVTRDRLYTRGHWAGTEFLLVDTGGLMSEAAKLPREERAQAMKSISAEGIPLAIERQAAAGVTEADAIIFVVDGQSGLNGNDEEIAEWLRRRHSGKPVVLAVNKCENAAKADLQAAEFWGLGLEPLPVSAISGSGTGDLLDRLVSVLPKPKLDQHEGSDGDDSVLSIAIVGRPNVGKSSMLNAFCGEERVIVSSMSGTTRDAIDTDITLPSGQAYKLIDTAGIRKRANVKGSKDRAEPLSVQRALGAIRRAEVAVLVIDAVDCTREGRFIVTGQDYRLAEIIAGEGRACVIAVNKWDAVEKDTNTMEAYRKQVLSELRPINWATVVFTSAVTGQRLQKVLEAATAAGSEHRRRISTATLNMVVSEASRWRSAPVARGTLKKGRIYYATQAATRPPTFVFFCNDATLFEDDYKRFMERQLRENIGFPGTPLRLYWRGKPPPIKLASSGSPAARAGHS